MSVCCYPDKVRALALQLYRELDTYCCVVCNCGILDNEHNEECAENVLLWHVFEYVKARHLLDKK